MTQKPDAFDVFSDLHEKLAAEFHARLTKGACSHCGRVPATVQELEAIRKFLTDNGITDGVRPKTPLRSLVDDMPFGAGDPEANIDRPAKKVS